MHQDEDDDLYPCGRERTSGSQARIRLFSSCFLREFLVRATPRAVPLQHALTLGSGAPKLQAVPVALEVSDGDWRHAGSPKLVLVYPLARARRPRLRVRVVDRWSWWLERR